MSWRTLAFLILAVGALAILALRTLEREKRALDEEVLAAFPGLDANLVVALRIENVGRDLHMRFERDPKGGWRLTDPVSARAETTPLDLIVGAAVRARGEPVAAEELSDLSKLGLDPPRFVLDVETVAEGVAKRQRAEFGAAELDGARLFARAGGRVLRVSRELEPLLDLPLHELRASTISDVDARAVLEVRRAGAFPADGAGPALDAGFEAVQEGGVWRATSPVTGLLDPGGIALYVQSGVNFRFERVFDEGARALSALGLDPPELRLTFGTVGTEVVEILLGRTGPTRAGGWLGTRAGSSVVWPVSAEDVAFFATPLEDLLDHKVLCLRRGAIRLVEIESALGNVRLERVARGWTCAAARAGSSVYGLAEPAETRAVEDAIGELERYELSGFLRGVAFERGPDAVSWRVEAEDGGAAGTFGAGYADAQGATDVLFQRAGESAVAHGDPAIAARLARDPEHYLTLKLLEADEAELSGLAVRGASGERRFARNPKGLWTRAGGDVEARELRGVLEGLLFVRVSERIPERMRAALEDRIEVELEVGPAEARAVRARFTVGLGRAGDAPRVEVEIDGRRGVLLDQRLHEKLRELLVQVR